MVARAHQDLIWSRQHEVNRLRSLLGLYYPAALAAFPDLTTRTAMTVLAIAPATARAAQLDAEDVLDLLAAAGWGRRRSEAHRLAKVFAAPQLRQPPEVEQAPPETATKPPCAAWPASSSASSTTASNTGSPYDEATAWPQPENRASPASSAAA